MLIPLHPLAENSIRHRLSETGCMRIAETFYHKETDDAISFRVIRLIISSEVFCLIIQISFRKGDQAYYGIFRCHPYVAVIGIDQNVSVVAHSELLHVGELAMSVT